MKLLVYGRFLEFLLQIQSNRKTLKIFPISNPSTTGIFNLTLSETAKTATIELYNMIGQKMYMDKIADLKEKTLYLNDLPKGPYLVRVIDGEAILTKSIIIKPVG
jgi:hypothetical protein